MATLQEIQARAKEKRAANATNVPADTTVVTPNSTPVDTSKFTESTGTYSRQNAQDAITSTFAQAPTQKVGGSNISVPNPVAPSVDSTTNTGVNPGTQGNKSTVAGGVNANATDEAIVNQVKKQATNTYNDNTSLNKKMYEDTKKTVTDVYAEQDVNMLKRIDDITLEGSEEDLRQKKRANEDAIILQNAQEKERAEQSANIAYVESQNAANENDAKIAADVALQQSNVAMAKLGLTLSTAGITQAQQIFTQGAYRIAELKTRNAYNVAKLKNDVAKVEFDHTNAVNTIIRESENKSYEIRSKLSKEIYDIKSNITLNKLEKQNAMNKATENYIKGRDDNEMNILAKLTGAYKTQEARVDSIYNIIKTQEKYANDKVNTYVASGQWSALPPSEKIRLEKEAGLATGTIDKQIRSSITTTIAKSMEGLPLTASGLAAIQVEALRLFDMGIGMEAAVASALQGSKEYQAVIAKKNAPKGTGGSSASTEPKGEVEMLPGTDGKLRRRIIDKNTKQPLTDWELVTLDSGESTGTVDKALSWLRGGNANGQIDAVKWEPSTGTQSPYLARGQ